MNSLKIKRKFALHSTISDFGISCRKASKLFQDDTGPSTSNDVDFEEEAKCPYCHTVKDPSFGHYRVCPCLCLIAACKNHLPPLFQSGSSGLKKGAVIWRYRCSMRQCTQFFGPLYRYNSKENSFDIIAGLHFSAVIV